MSLLLCHWLWIYTKILITNLLSRYKFRGVVTTTQLCVETLFSPLPIWTLVSVPTSLWQFHCLPLLHAFTASPSLSNRGFKSSSILSELQWPQADTVAWETSSSRAADSKGWGEPSASQNYGPELPWTRLVTVTWRWKALYSITTLPSDLPNPASLCLIETLFSLCRRGHSGWCKPISISADLPLKQLHPQVQIYFVPSWDSAIKTKSPKLNMFSSQADPGHTLMKLVFWKAWAEKAEENISLGMCLQPAAGREWREDRIYYRVQRAHS